MYKQVIWSLVEFLYLIDNYTKLTTKELAGDLRKPEKDIIKYTNIIATNDDISALQFLINPCAQLPLVQTVSELLTKLKGHTKTKATIKNIIIRSTEEKTRKFNTLKSGYKNDLGIAVRSGWEANVLRWLNYNKILWQYEPRTFIFTGIKHGTVMYTPDIYLPKTDEWIEIKGHIKSIDKVKMRRMKKYYLDEFNKISAITGSSKTASTIFFNDIGIPIRAYYNDIKKSFSSKINGWE